LLELFRTFQAKIRESLIWKKYQFRKKGLYTLFPGGVCSDIQVESPVFLGYVFVGQRVYIGKHTTVNSGKLWDDITIGRYCSIGYDVFVAPPEHPTTFLSTCDSFYKNADYYKSFLNGKATKIGNDVWIGANVVIKKGVQIGDGVVVGAGAVVVDNPPPYSIIGGVPARVIKFRFNEDTTKDLLELKWWNLPTKAIRRLPFQDIEKCIRILKKQKFDYQKGT
jgi:virginiamycin A acetyltransferase